MSETKYAGDDKDAAGGKNAKDANAKNNMRHVAKAYSIYQRYLWSMLIIIGGIVLVIKFLLR